eukprot:CAMPEP_0171719712 /NCGR_PEP_ID=MMETSP0991-20121206/21353_1 /TAXON_ID=483369 /ORGANISM="non described non described, Strain CCMP2098" /LENGTH=384 /DNA_ID=CAMNT_0012311295 /DNA_START=46 /DNA_END=1200 /DNA_ORIENTATION=-
MASKYDDDDVDAYAGSKYSDDGGGESKFGGGCSGSGGCAESKGTGGTSYEVGVVLPPIVQAFAHHVMSKKYRDAVEAFFASKCARFKGVDPKAEQMLEYTQVYEAYVGVVEEQLEGFCAGHHVSSEDLFLEVQDVMRAGNLDDEFLPAVLRVAEYSYFMEQMVLTADHKTHIQDALRRQEVASNGLTGVWRVDKKRTKFDDLDQYLAAIRVPAVFRGLAKGTFFSNKEVVVLLDDQGTTFKVVANSPFGMQCSEFQCDDRVHEVANPWGAEVPVRAALKEASASAVSSVVVEHCRPAHLPKGSAVYHTWSRVDGGLRCTMEVREPERSAVAFDLFYGPMAAKDFEPKTKGQQPSSSKRGKDGGGGAAEAKGEPTASSSITPGAK